MRILQIAQTLDVRTGGVARAVILLSDALVGAGHEVKIVTLDSPNMDWRAVTSLEVHGLGTGRGGYGYSKDLLPSLRAHGGNFDRVIVNGLWQYASFVAWRRYAGSGVPYYVFPHGMLDLWFKRTYPLKHLKKWLYWPWAEYRVLRDARAVIFTSEEERRQARESFWLYRCREEISPLGVAAPAAPALPGTEAEEFFARFPELRQKRILLFLGRLHPKKGCDLLLEAFAKISPNDQSLVLVMAGPDQSGGDLQKRASANVVFTGMLEGSMKWSAMKAAEVFVLPSHQENFGLSVVEALACGIPVLISDRVNIWREITDDGAGYVEHDDLAGTQHLLERWLATPADARETMGANARRCFETRFEIQRAAQSLLRILE